MNLYRSNRSRLAGRAAVLGPLLVAVALPFAGCGKKSHREARPAESIPSVQVQTVTVERKSSPLEEEVVGTVRARRHATIEAKMTGRIIDLPLRLGQSIRTGQLVVKLDAPESGARLKQADAAFKQAQRDWNRTEALFKQQAATRSDYDSAQSRLEVAQASLDEAGAMDGQAQIWAPINGVVTHKFADLGDLAVPGKPLVEIEDPSTLQLDADVPEAMAAQIVPGGTMPVRAESLTNDVLAKVAEIAPAADPVSRTLRVKLDIPPESKLRSGQFARLLLSVGQAESVRIPASAVVDRGQMEVVFVVENNAAKLHLVKTGRPVGSEIEILSGLESGDKVVVQGAEQLVDNQPVTLQ